MSTPHSSFAKKYGPWAVVTGSSRGIGAEFARAIARRKLNVILTAPPSERRALDEVAGELRAQHSVEAHVLTADLSTHAGVDALVDSLSAYDVGMLVNNAGVGYPSAFMTAPLERIDDMLAVNAVAVARLTRLLGARIVARSTPHSPGALVFVSSLSSPGMAFLATYSATKGFVSSLAMALSAEFTALKSPVEVLCVEPGLVQTAMVEQLEQMAGEVKGIMQPSVVAEQSVQQLGRVTRYTPGWMNRLTILLSSYFPTFMRNRMAASFLLSLNAESKHH